MEKEMNVRTVPGIKKVKQVYCTVASVCYENNRDVSHASDILTLVNQEFKLIAVGAGKGVGVGVALGVIVATDMESVS
jgi:hypothetical protein